MSNPVARWQKVWFFLRNDVDALLPVVTGSHPVPQPKWDTVWPRQTSICYSPCGMLFNSCGNQGIFRLTTIVLSCAGTF
jgi:hypothetical protein